MTSANPRPVNDGVGGLEGVHHTIEQKQRLQEMQRAWRAYLGEVPNALKVDPVGPDVNVKANRLAPIVDTGLYYLFGLSLKLEIDPDSPGLSGKAQALAAQDALDGCWGDEDDMMTLLAKFAQNGGVFGQAFAKVLPPDPDVERQFPRVVVLDPQNITVQTDPDDCDCVVAYIICYDATLPTGVQITKRQIIAKRSVYDEMATLDSRMATLESQVASAAISGGGSPQMAGGTDSDDDQNTLDADAQWVIVTQARYGVGGEWQRLGAPEPWPHPWPPISDCQNLPMSNQHWGQPDLTPDLIHLNETLNFVLSNINSIGLSHGHPWVWAAGADMSQVTTSPGGIITLRDPNAKLEALVAKGDIAGLMAYAADLRSSMDEQSKVPGVATGRIAELPRGQMSGVAVRMLYMPLLFKTTFKRRTYGKLIRELCTRLLALAGFGDGTDAGGVHVTLHWQDPMPTDDLAEAQTAQTWQAVGVSADTLLQRAGFDPDAEASKNEEAQKRSLELQTQGAAPLSAQQPPALFPPAALATPSAAAPSQQASQQPPRVAPTPPTNHPAAIAARQRMQVANGKPPTPNGL